MDNEQWTTERGTPYTVTGRDAYGGVRVTVGDHKAAKWVRRDASPRYPNAPLRWRSADGQSFGSLAEVADSMAWAL